METPETLKNQYQSIFAPTNLEAQVESKKQKKETLGLQKISIKAFLLFPIWKDRWNPKNNNKQMRGFYVTNFSLSGI